MNIKFLTLVLAVKSSKLTRACFAFLQRIFTMRFRSPGVKKKQFSVDGVVVGVDLTGLANYLNLL